MGVSPVAVRRLSDSEWPVLRRLRLAALADSPHAFLGDRAHEEARTPESWQHSLVHEVWFVAFIDAEPAGLLSVVLDPRTQDRYVESMWVRPQSRGQGITTALFAAAEQEVADHGGAVLRLWVLEGNDSAAAVYRRYGFRSTGLRQPVPGPSGTIEVEFVIPVPSRPPGAAPRAGRPGECRR